MGEDSEPELGENPLTSGSYPHLEQPLPQEPRDETILYLLNLHLTVSVETGPGLDQLGAH